MKKFAIVVALIITAHARIVHGQAPADRSRATCEQLSTLAVSGGTITLAKVVDAGVPVEGLGVVARPFCRVAGTLRPSTDSNIRFELWLPASNWNLKFQAVGNGAFNGTINYESMMIALNRGYATASTDTGHSGGGASWAVGHPEKVIDFGYRAVHEMTVASKKIIAGYYDSGPRFSYWNGCSAGGRQGIQEAQRFPADFDGIIAGAPGLDWTGRAAQALRVAKVAEKTEAARLSGTQRELLHRAVVQTCDDLDGVKDGLIDNPKVCKFDPGILQCKGTDATSCLTTSQVATARLTYSSLVNPKTKREITALEPGSELGWTDTGWTASARATGLDQFRFLVFKDPNWDVQDFSFDSDIVRAEETDNNTINALDANLEPFIGRGGRLIQYHGWSDPQISPGNSTQYYHRVLERLGGVDKIHNSYRLFMAPGMGHCGGGEGPNTFDAVSALERWVEQGVAPDQIVASHITNGTVNRTRPLCPYPLEAMYQGTGSTDDTKNFVCKAQ